MNHKAIAVLVVFLLAAIWDVNSRFLLDVKANVAQDNQDVIHSQLPFKLTKNQQQELAQLYLSYDGKKEKTEPKSEQGMSLAEQSEQNGLLDQLYSGDLRISLRAVINEPSKVKDIDNSFGIVLVEDLKEKQQNLQKVKRLQQLYGYQIQDIRLDKITLVSLQNSQRKVILSLYQKQSSAKAQ